MTVAKHPSSGDLPLFDLARLPLLVLPGTCYLLALNMEKHL